MAEIIKFLKFTEKQLIPICISIVVTILAQVFFDSPNKIIAKIGMQKYQLLVFLLSFIGVELIIWIFRHTCIGLKKVNNIRLKRKKEKEKESERVQRNIIEEESKISSIIDYVDSLGIQDYKYLLNFLNTGNSHIEIEDRFENLTELLKSKYVIRTLIKDSAQKQVFLQNDEKDMTYKTSTFISFPINITEPAIYAYKLNDDFYELIVKAYLKYGKISHFDRDND